MKAHLWPAMVISSGLVLPLVVLEATIGGTSFTTFPVALFVFLWLLATAAVVLVAPAVRARLLGADWTGSRVAAAAGAIVAAVMGWLWIAVVIDQMPCFLGVPNCD